MLDKRLARQQSRTQACNGTPISLPRLQLRLKHLTGKPGSAKPAAQTVVVNSRANIDQRTHKDLVQDLKNPHREMWAPEVCFLVTSDLLVSYCRQIDFQACRYCT